MPQIVTPVTLEGKRMRRCSYRLCVNAVSLDRSCARIPVVVNGRVQHDQCIGHRTVQVTDRFVARKI
jgi:hypothetical protein